MQMNWVNQMHFEFTLGMGGNSKKQNLGNVAKGVESRNLTVGGAPSVVEKLNLCGLHMHCRAIYLVFNGTGVCVPVIFIEVLFVCIIKYPCKHKMKELK